MAHAEIYKCNSGGKLVFSDRPCGDNAEQIEMPNVPQVGGALSNPSADGFLQHREAKHIESKITQLERKKEELRRAMDRDMAEWERKRARANNNLAGATWESSLAKEAEVKMTRYQSEIDQIDREIDRLRDERDRVLAK
jgi:chromosome segregation ATPase